MPPLAYFLLNFSSLNTGRTLPRFPNEFSKHSGLFIPSLRKIYMALLRYFPIKISPFRWLPFPLKPLEQRINISQPVPLFSLFQEPSTLTKIIEEIFDVNANEDIEDMDICDFTQDTSLTPAPIRKLPVTSTILTTLLEVHCYIPPNSKQKQPPNEESNSKTIALKSTNLQPTTSQPSATTPSTAALKRKPPIQITKSPK